MTKSQLLVKRICSPIRLQLQTAKKTFKKLLGEIAIRFNLLQVCPSVPFCIHVSVGSGPIFDRTNFLHRTVAILLQCTVQKSPYIFFAGVSIEMAFFDQWRATVVVSRLSPRKLSNNSHGSGVYTSPRKNRTVPAQSKFWPTFVLLIRSNPCKVLSLQNFVRTPQTGSKSSLTV